MITRLIRKLTERIAGNVLTVDDLVFLDVVPSAARGCCWALGVVKEYRFAARLCRHHSLIPWRELGHSRISKLKVQQLDDEKVVANFDQGWETVPKTKTACDVVELLVTSLADRIYGK